MNGKAKPPYVLFALIGCGAGLALFAAGVAFVVFIALTAIRSSKPYRVAVDLAERDPRVIALLGAPVEESWFVQGKVNTENANGTAALDIPLHGPKGKGTLHVEAKKTDGVWTYSVMTVGANDQTVDLLRSTSP